MHVPPHGKTLEAAEFFTDTTSSSRVSLVALTSHTPLKQFWWETSFFTTAFWTPFNAMPCRLNRWITPGPSITMSVRPVAPTPSPGKKFSVVAQLLSDGVFDGPVILNPFKPSLMLLATKLMHGRLSSCWHSTSHTSRASRSIGTEVGRTPQRSMVLEACAGGDARPSVNAETTASSVTSRAKAHVEWRMRNPPFWKPVEEAGVREASLPRPVATATVRRRADRRAQETMTSSPGAGG